MCKVSVIVPVYNVEKYLPKCVESILNQTEKEIEIILVDDGSTDESGAICERYAQEDARVKVLHQKNAGQGSARNNGLSVACGEYVLFVDSDDWIESDLIEITYACAKKHSVEMVVFDIQAVDEQQNVLYTHSQKIPANTVFSADTCKSLLLSDPSPCNKILKRTWLIENQFAFPEMMFEDLIAFSNLFSLVHSCAYWNERPLYNYFLRPNSTIRNGDPEKTTKNRIAAVLEIYRFYEEKHTLEKFKDEVEWVITFHGFFLPCREVLNFTADAQPYIKRFRQNLDSLGISPYSNPYFNTLTKKEQAMFKLLYSNKCFGIVRCLFRVNKLLKRR